MSKCLVKIVTGGWKFVQIEPVLGVISKHCQDLRGLNLAGWKRLNSEHLKSLTANCPLLSRLDLSSITVRIIILVVCNLLRSFCYCLL